MRKNLIILTLAALAVVLVAVWSNAAEPEKGKKNEVTVNPVTVAIKGMACQDCAGKLEKALAKVDGVSEAKVTFKTAQVTAKLDENKITAAAFTRTVAAKMATIEKGQDIASSLVVYIDADMCKNQKTMCRACFTEIPRVLKEVKGVKAVSLDKTGKIASITFSGDAKATTAELTKALQKSDYGFIVSYTAPDANKAEKTDKAAGSDTGCACCAN